MTLAPDRLDVDLGTDVGVSYETSNRVVARTVTVGSRVTTQERPLPEASLGDSAFPAWWSAFIRGERVRASKSAEKVRFLDLFSSVGGLSVGAMEAMGALGLSGLPLLAADVDARALQVYKQNLKPRVSVPESVRGLVDFRVSGTGPAARFAYEPTIADERLAKAGAVDLILAGPPCQGHSSLNNHSRHDDPKNLLYLTVPAVAVAVGAKHVVIENVPNVQADKKGVVQTALALLRGNGYNISAGVLAADKFGWPQTRKRYFMVASRDSVPLPFGMLADTFSHDALPVSWLLKDVEDRALDESDVMWSVPQLSQENRMRVDYLHRKNEFNLPDEIRPDCHKDGHTYPSVYGRMYPDRPAPTITGGFLTPGRGRFIHPTQPRVLTPREAARIQGFPDWFNFLADPQEPSRAELSRWIGNAVPTLLGFVATLAALGGTSPIE